MKENNENKITGEDILNVFNVPGNEQVKPEETEKEKATETKPSFEPATIEEEEFVSTKNPTFKELMEKFEQLLGMFPEEEQKKVKTEAVERLIDKANEMDEKEDKPVSNAVKDFVGKEMKEMENMLKDDVNAGKVDKKVLDIFSNAESMKVKNNPEQKTAMPYGGSLKINLPEKLPLTNAEMEALHGEAVLEHEEREKKHISPKSIKIEKTQEELKREEEVKKDREWREQWAIKKAELMKNISERAPLKIEIKSSMFSKSKEARIKELENKKIVLDESVERHIESNDFVINNVNETIKVIHLVPNAARVGNDIIGTGDMYHIAESLKLKPCPDNAVLDLILKLKESAPSIKVDEPNFNIFSNDNDVYNLKYDKKTKKMFVKFATDIDGDSFCFFEIPQPESK